jgi:hypothetical protein
MEESISRKREAVNPYTGNILSVSLNTGSDLGVKKPARGGLS